MTCVNVKNILTKKGLKMNEEKNINKEFIIYDSMSLKELSEEMKKVAEDLEKAKTIKTELQKIFDHLRLNKIPEKMDEEDIKSVTFPDIGRVGLTADLYASIPADKKEDAHKWLRENNLGGIIVETVNAQTLKATMKSILKKGEIVIPEETFKVTPYSRASITKVK